MPETYDFSGWATKNNLKCSDGRVIAQNAFAHNDGQTVPLVWNHQHNEPENILGHALLENREDGIYAYCSFNDSESAKNAKILIKHKDISALSIFANGLKQTGNNVIHGAIREVSMVLAGANPGAFIDSILCHGQESDGEAVIFTGEPVLIHAGTVEQKVDQKEEPKAEPTEDSKKVESVADVFDTLTEKQKTAVYAIVTQIVEDSTTLDDNTKNDEGEESIMKHNVFDTDGAKDGAKNTFAHADVPALITEAKRLGSLKEAFLQHSITNVDYLFPEAQAINSTPEFISRDVTWVQKLMSGVYHTPFSRIKSIFADITEDDARANGYIKGNITKEEVFSLLKRTTTPTTIYKKQKMDRDDIVDIVDIDVVAWLKAEMRLMLDEEIARAVIVGDGRLVSSDDKINEQNIRPIWKDDDLYTIKTLISLASTATDDERSKAFIRAAVKSRKQYKGSGSPYLFTTEDVLTDCLLMEDSTGRVIYDTIEKLATALRVKEIITVPVMEGCTRVDSDTKTRTLLGIIVNPTDYKLGADKGGAINMFDDFDIDYNKQKYLIETRCSGALAKPYSAIAIEMTTVVG